ncbi:MAG: TIGR04255 family protein [Gemmatimonadaceae bacterium]
MEVAYRKPTLTETYAELRLAEGSLTEARFFEVVPTLKKRGFADIEFATSGIRLDIREGGAFPREQQRIRCWRNERKELIQVGEDLVIANLTGEYPGWDAFLGIFEECLTALQESLPGVVIDFLSLNTIDAFSVAKRDFRVDDFLHVGGEIIPRWYSGVRESFDIDIGRGLLPIDGANRQIHIKATASSDPVHVRMRCHFQERVPTGSKLEDVLETLHRESNVAFEALITDRVRNDIMGGTKS